MSRHLTPAELQTGARSELPSGRRQEILAHLLEGCEACRAAVGWKPRGRGRVGVLEEPQEKREARYDAPVARSFAQVIRLKRELEAQKAVAREAGERLAAGEEPAAEAQGGLGLYEALLQRVALIRHDDPREAVRLSRQAVAAAQALDPALYGERQVADFQARAWGELANALRTADDLFEAEEAFEQAFEVLERGTGSAALAARLHDLHASLLGTQRNFQLAFLALDVVRDLYLEIGDTHAAGRVMLKKAYYLQNGGQPEEALKAHRQGTAWLDGLRDPKLAFIALHNQMASLVDCGRFREAKRLLFRNRHRLHEAGRVSVLKFLWLEGKIRYGLGELEAAGQAFLEVKQGFEEAGLGFAAALSSLDATLVHMRQGRMDEAEALVTEAAAVFAALGIHREALSAVCLLQKSFALREATTVLVEQTAALLRTWEADPEARGAARLE